MKRRIRDRLAEILHSNEDPHREEMTTRADAAIKTTEIHTEMTERRQQEVDRLLSSIRREIAVMRISHKEPST